MSAIAFRTSLLAVLLFPAPAVAAHSEWSDAEQSQMRLLLEAPRNGVIAGGIEIVLAPGWYTYWRNPGESGVPPKFDFSGSENVANVEVRYPAPVRYDDGASVSLIYRDEVVFPLLVTPRDAGEPLTLKVDANFGVCSDICVPTTAEAAVKLSAAPDALSATRLESYSPRVPKPPELGRFDVEAVTADGDALLIDVRMPDSPYLDLFADAPDGWYIGQPKLVERTGSVSRYRLSLAGQPSGAVLKGQTFRFVAVSGEEAIEKAVGIP